MLKEKGAQHEKSCEKGLFEVVSLLFLITLMSHGGFIYFQIQGTTPIWLGVWTSPATSPYPPYLFLSYLIYAST